MPHTPTNEAATNFVTATETLTQQVKTWLAAYKTTWDVRVFSGTNPADLAKFVFGLRPPAAVVMYDGSNWQAEPDRRALDLSVVVVAANADLETGSTTVRGMLDDAVAAIDWQQKDQALFRASRDSVVDLGQGLACVRLQLTVEDR